MRGIHLENPVCYCSSYPLSRVQVANENDQQSIPRSVFFKCAIGGCNFFEYMLNDAGGVLVLRGGRLNEVLMTSLGF